MPAGVAWHDASELVKYDEFAKLRARGVPAAVVADLGGLRGTKEELRNGAVFVWLAALAVQWVRSVKGACSPLPSAAFGHVVGTMEATAESRAGVIQHIRKGMFGFLRRQFDYEYAATPFRVTSRTPLVDALLVV